MCKTHMCNRQLVYLDLYINILYIFSSKLLLFNRFFKKYKAFAFSLILFSQNKNLFIVLSYIFADITFFSFPGNNS